MEPHPNRIVHAEDALSWLRARPATPGVSVVTSMPDLSEFPNYSLADWKRWFTDAAALALAATAPDGVTVFFQSDVKHSGAWVDKAYLCQRAAETIGHELLWHRIACRAPAGTRTFGRPAYSHIVCFSKELRLPPGSDGGVDVLPHVGAKTWERGMGFEAARQIAHFIKTHTASHTVVNPFCGEGAVLAAANHEGLRAIGIERSPKRAERARAQRVRADEQGWVLT